MGWVSLLEDTLERIEDSIRLAEDSFKNSDSYTEEHRQTSFKALGDARVILAQAWEHLELATSPEMDYAHAIKELEKKISSSENKYSAAEYSAKKYELEAANSFAKLQDAKREIKVLKKENKKLEKQVDKMAHENFASAVEVFSTPGMMQKHKPNK